MKNGEILKIDVNLKIYNGYGSKGFTGKVEARWGDNYGVQNFS